MYMNEFIRKYLIMGFSMFLITFGAFITFESSTIKSDIILALAFYWEYDKKCRKMDCEFNNQIYVKIEQNFIEWRK